MVTNNDTSNLLALGREVPIPDIEKELQKLWAADGAGTRASLMNFAIYSEQPDSLEHNSTLLAKITQEHACRALLINNLQSCDLEEHHVRAWITAHCQLRNGKKSVCSEQLSFLLQCDGNRHVRNIVFSHLDSDLPLVFWWQGELNNNFEDRLYSVIDRLIIDSADWADPLVGFAKLRAAHEDDSSRFALNDLAWSRTYKMRRALANCFEDPASIREITSLEKISITHGVKGQVPALMFAAWIAQRLGLTPGEGCTCFEGPDGQNVQLELTLDEQASTVGLLTLSSANGTFTLQRDTGHPFIRSRTEINGHVTEDLTPATRDMRSAHICAQLERAGNNRLYFAMVPKLENMLKSMR